MKAVQLLLFCGVVRAALPDAARPWRYEDHTSVAVSTPCATSNGVACPAPATGGCCVAAYSAANKTGCLVPAVAGPTGPGCKPPCHKPGTTCCTPGAPLPLSSSLKNVLVFGDSVSIDCEAEAFLSQPRRPARPERVRLVWFRYALRKVQPLRYRTRPARPV